MDFARTAVNVFSESPGRNMSLLVTCIILLVLAGASVQDLWNSRTRRRALMLLLWLALLGAAICFWYPHLMQDYEKVKFLHELYPSHY